MKERVLIGITGGTGSGKTQLAKSICQSIGSDNAVLIQQDSYYHDLSDIPFYESGKRNFDHPDAFDGKLLNLQVRQLLQGETIEQPIYDCKNHRRTERTREIAPCRIILLEGILIMNDAELRTMMDLKIFLDTPPDIRLIRRIRRDIEERNKELESIFYQYENSVRPMYVQLIEPVKAFADIVIPHGKMNRRTVELLTKGIESLFDAE